MPNNYFRFKQFTVQQDKAAMKVCTDGCLFGAWVADIFRNQTLNILDVGTGTGLLSLMLAQETAGHIDAVEIDVQAFEEAGDNFIASPWHERLRVEHMPFQQYKPPHFYDLLVSNPPFYSGDLPSPNDQRSKALHSTDLTLTELLNGALQVIAPGGKIALLLPARREVEFEVLASQRFLHIIRKAAVRQSPAHGVFRLMYLVSREASEISRPEEIVIKDNDNEYSKRFKGLLKDYYLHL